MPLALIPAPVSLVESDGAPFVLDATTAIAADVAFADVADLLAATLRASTGLPLPLADDGAIALVFDDRLAGEAYELTAEAKGVILRAGTPHGAFNAVQTLKQLLPAAVESGEIVQADWSVPAVEIADAPRFGHRGLMLDVARSFSTVAEVKAYIDAMVLVKLNVLHLHLADDQGWRLEITNEGRAEDDTIDYTRLTALSGGTAINEQGYLDEPGHTGFYTQDEYRELVAYAAARFVRIIGEIDVPGHINGALHAIPELNTAGSHHLGTPEEPTAPVSLSGNVGATYLDPDSPATRHFLHHVFRQLAALNPGERLHLGGDEPHDMEKRYGKQIFLGAVADAVEAVHATGERAMGWNEVASCGGLRPGDVVQYWAGETKDLVNATESGATILMSCAAGAYLDMKYHDGTAIGLNWAARGICDVAQYYGWDPATEVEGIDEARIEGVEAALWTETVRGLDQAFYMTFPRALGTAEIGWSPQSGRNVAEFVTRVGAFGPRLVAADVNFYDTPFVPWGAELVGVAGADGEIGRLYAPGTITDRERVSGDLIGTTSLTPTQAPQHVDDVEKGQPSYAGLAGHGPSASVLSLFEVRVRWADGTCAPVRFEATRPRGVLNATGYYRVFADVPAGQSAGVLIGSDGREVPFSL